MELKDKLTHYLNNGITSWTGERFSRGFIVFLEILDKHRDLLDYTGINTAFEGGTHRGHNAVDFSNVFDKVITAETNKGYYDYCINNHAHVENVEFVLGDATEVMDRLLSSDRNKRYVLLLDDHTGYQSYIEQELISIRDKTDVDHIIIIDDVDKLGIGTYPTAERINQLVYECNQDYQIVEDNYKYLIFKRKE